MKHVIATLPLLVACAEGGEARLDHAQILAVRAEPAHVAPGERARIDILAGDTAGNVFEAEPETLSAFGEQGSLAIEHTSDGWFVTGGETPDVATIVVTLAIDGDEWPATKSLVVGDRADNPDLATTIDGIASSEMSVPVGSTPALAVAATGTEPFTYAWYSSVGDLTFFRSANATLEAAEPAEGTILIVVRDDVGGVSWQIVPARVE